MPAERLRENWLASLDLLGLYEGIAEVKYEMTIGHAGGVPSEFKPGWASVPSRRKLLGAKIRAVKFDGLDGKYKVGWCRYLAAHTSKSKQA